MTSPLSQPLRLPNGTVLPNRIVKTAMSEGLADMDNRATGRLEALYRQWAGSGAGLLLSGNIQVDRFHLERPGNVVLEDETGLPELARVVAAGRVEGAHFWAQISHTGRQVDAAINPAPLSPSNVKMDFQLRVAGYAFAPPREMTEADIATAIAQFARTARLAKKAGFTGIQLHGAHGYLISQFLSPRLNRRSDGWGGSPANRARFLIELLGAVRAAVGAEFPVGLKLNASDFQVGGFTNADCIELVRLLNETGLDMLELSGGSLEQPKNVGVTLRDQGIDGRRASTLQREAYFLEFAGAVRAVARMPVMVTGGFRTLAAMEAALEGGELDFVGVGRPLIADPRSVAKLLSGELTRLPSPEDSLDVFDIVGWYNIQLERMGGGLAPDPNLRGADATLAFKEIERKILTGLLARRNGAAKQDVRAGNAMGVRATRPAARKILRRALAALMAPLQRGLIARAQRRFG